MSSERRAGVLLPGAVIGLLLLIAVLAPILATERPLAAIIDGGLVLPAFVELPLVGPLFDAVAARGIDWSAPPPAARIVLRAPVPYSDRGIRLEESLRPPDRRHWFGTDALGRDLLARCVHGARVSLLVGFGSGILALLVGCALGSIAGLRGGGVDLAIVRLTDVMSCFPAFVLALAFVAARGRAGIPPLVAGIVLSRFTGSARLVRAETLRRRGGDLWVAARAAGASRPRLFLRHLLPLLAAPLSALAVFGVAQAIILEAGLSFAGLGVEPPTPSWGAILSEAQPGTAWWPIVFPAACLFLVLGSLCLAAERLEGAWRS